MTSNYCCTVANEIQYKLVCSSQMLILDGHILDVWDKHFHLAVLLHKSLPLSNHIIKTAAKAS